jgi:hypothetical protein
MEPMKSGLMDCEMPGNLILILLGNVMIADVGQNQIEEINQMPISQAGLNYGWRCYEGNMLIIQQVVQWAFLHDLSCGCL